VASVPLKPQRGGFVRPFGCGLFIRDYLLGHGPNGSPQIDPRVGAPQADIFHHYKTAIIHATALDRATREEERQARHEKRAIDPNNIERLAQRGINPEENQDLAQPSEDKVWRGFLSNIQGIYLMDYQVKGYFKEAASILSKGFPGFRKSGDPLGVATIKGRMDNCLFIDPRRLYFGLKEPDGILERPLRAETLQGKRTALARSDMVKEGRTLSFEIRTLVQSPIEEKHVRLWLEYGERGKGMGEFRNGGYGRFIVEEFTKL